MWPPVLTGSKAPGDWWTSSSPVHSQSSKPAPKRAADPHPVTYASGIERKFLRDMLSSGGGLRTLRSLFDKRCDRLGLRHVDSMAALDLHDRRTHVHFQKPRRTNMCIRCRHAAVLVRLPMSRETLQ